MVSSVDRKIDKLIADRQNKEGRNSQSNKEDENTDLNNKIFSLEEYKKLGADRKNSMILFFQVLDAIPKQEIEHTFDSIDYDTKLFILNEYYTKTK